MKVGGRWGYIDTTGKLVVNPQFDDVDDFDGALARVTIGQGSGTGANAPKIGYIDKTGKYVWNPTN